jgi:putative addiction module killer protein
MIIKQTKIFIKWFESLSKNIKDKIIEYLDRLLAGNFSNCLSVGHGVHELKINYQKGFRIYFTNINGEIVLLLCGGDKSSQKNDIRKAIELEKYLKGEKNEPK